MSKPTSTPAMPTSAFTTVAAIAWHPAFRSELAKEFLECAKLQVAFEVRVRGQRVTPAERADRVVDSLNRTLVQEFYALLEAGELVDAPELDTIGVENDAATRRWLKDKDGVALMLSNLRRHG